MVKVVLISRKTDGLIFCEISDDSSDKNLMVVRNTALEFLKNMQDKKDCCTVNLDNQSFQFHYKVVENIVYLIITDNKYPQKLSYCFLNEVDEAFQNELKSVFGSGSVDYYSKLETVDRAYYFIKFEKFLKKKKSEYNDPNSNDNISKLNKEIMDLHQIMTENISLLIDRDKNLESVYKISNTIKDDSKTFRKRAYEVRIKLLLTKYAPFIIIGVVLLLFIYFKLYW